MRSSRWTSATPLRTPLPDVLRVKPAVLMDARGFFMESYSARRYAEAGIAERFVQDNVSRSARGVLRGLHYQHPHGQGKLVQVLMGEVFDVTVDLRVGSPTFGKWVGEHLSGENKRQLFTPPGFAHGFLVTSDEALVDYKCTEYYRPEADRALRWDDPAIGIEWPTPDVVLSEKDRAAPLLAMVAREELPGYPRWR